MEITEVRIKLMDGVQDRLLGFCSITFDRCFVVRDLKIIKGSRGAFVAMPSRKLTERCRDCGHKNPLRSVFCSQCGIRLAGHHPIRSAQGKAKLYADIAHPIHSECRDQIQQRVLAAYEEEQVLSRQSGYVCRYDDFGEFDLDLAESDHWDEEFAKKERALSPSPDHPSPDHPESAPESHHASAENLMAGAVHAQGSPLTHSQNSSSQAENLVQDNFGDGIL